jgi:hypothetical protein
MEQSARGIGSIYPEVNRPLSENRHRGNERDERKSHTFDCAAFRRDRAGQNCRSTFWPAEPSHADGDLMRKILFAPALAPAAFSQAPTVAPPLLEINCDAGSFTAPAKPYAAVKAAVDVVALVSITGMPQTWTVEQHNNFASIEDLDKAISATATARPRYDSGQPQTCCRSLA